MQLVLIVRIYHDALSTKHKKKDLHTSESNF